MAPRGKAFDEYETKDGEKLKVEDPYRAMEKTRDPNVLKWVDAEVDELARMMQRNKGFKKKWQKANQKYYPYYNGQATGADLHWDDHYIMEYEAPSDDPWTHTKLLRFKKPLDTTFD